MQSCHREAVFRGRKTETELSYSVTSVSLRMHSEGGEGSPLECMLQESETLIT